MSARRCSGGKAPSLKAGSNPMNARRRKQSRLLAGDGSERSASLRRLHEDLPGLRLPLPLHRRRRRALVSEPRRAPGGGRPRGHLPHPAPMGARRPRRSAGSEDRQRWAAHGALRGGGTTSDIPPGRVRRRRALASAAARAPLRRGPHRLVSVLLAAGGRRGAARGRLSARGRLARGLDPGVLGRLPRRGRRADRQPRAGPLPARAPARVLLFAPSRPQAGRGRAAKPADGPGGRIRRTARAEDSPPGRAAGRLRRPPHSGEARAGARSRAGGATAHISGRSRGDLRRRTGTRAGLRARTTAGPGRRYLAARIRRRRRGGGDPQARGLHGASLAT